MATDKLGQELQIGDLIFYTVHDDLRPAVVRGYKKNPPKTFGTSTYHYDDTVYVGYAYLTWENGENRLIEKKGTILEARKILKVPIYLFERLPDNVRAMLFQLKEKYERLNRPKA